MSEEKKTIRHLAAPENPAQWLWRLRWTIARRAAQFAVLAAFIGTVRFGWNVFGLPLLQGDLSSSKLLDFLPLADPFAALQRFLAQWWLSGQTLVGAALVLAFYAFVGGRAFCAWVCPMNLVTDAAHWLRAKMGLRANVMSLPSWLRYVLLAVCLVVCLTSGTAAFEAISPQAFIWREAVYGVGLGLVSAVAGVFALDFAVSRRAWCGHLCPLGAFWSLWGKVSLAKVRYDDKTCTRCGDCLKVCPEPQVINFNEAAKSGWILPGECTSCGKCMQVCPEDSLKFGIKKYSVKSK